MAAVTVPEEVISSLAMDYFGSPVVSVRAAGNGRNSRVFRVQTERGDVAAAKKYLGRTKDGLSRMDVEYNALRFFRENSLAVTPAPFIRDESNDLALYEFVDGAAVDSSDVTVDDIDRLISFLARLEDMKTLPGAEVMELASEACMSFSALEKNIGGRLERLKKAPYDKRLDGFLRNEFRRAYGEILRRANDRYERNGLPKAEPLEKNERALSPSDFGFHNTLRTPDDALVFVDFEYFGWDDPAKLISDFLLHPAMSLAESHKSRFLEGALRLYGAGGKLAARLRALYPVFAAKWVTILLNEFTQEHLERTGMSAEPESAVRAFQDAQLEKARAMLDNSLIDLEVWTR